MNIHGAVNADNLTDAEKQIEEIARVYFSNPQWELRKSHYSIESELNPNPRVSQRFIARFWIG